MDKCLTLSSYLKKVPTTKTEINWWELSPSHPVVLDPHYQKKILDRAVKKAGSYTLLGTAIKIPRQALSACHRLRRPPSLGYLKRILQYLEADYGEANNDILEIARLKNPKLPFKLNTPEGAEVMAAFLSDGHIPKESIKNPMYCAYEKELHLRLIRVCKNIFGAFDAHIKMGHKSLITRFPVPIGKSLVLGGVPAGSKVVKNPFLPRSIIEGNEKIRTAYLRRVFDDEGDVHLSASKKAVRLTRSSFIAPNESMNRVKSGKWIFGVSGTTPNNLVLGEYLLLNALGIDAKLYAEGVYKSRSGRMTAKWRIQIAQQDNLRKFADKIGFCHSIKRKKLKKLLKSYKNRKTPNGFTEKIIWRHMKKLSKKKKSITFNDIGKKLIELGMTYDYASSFLKRFLKTNKITKIKRGVYLVRRFN